MTRIIGIILLAFNSCYKEVIVAPINIRTTRLILATVEFIFNLKKKKKKEKEKQDCNIFLSI